MNVIRMKTFVSRHKRNSHTCKFYQENDVREKRAIEKKEEKRKEGEREKREFEDRNGWWFSPVFLC